MKKQTSKKTLIIIGAVIILLIAGICAGIFIKNNQESTTKTITVTFVSENDEILKTSFKESISDSDIVNNGLDALKVATNYVKNIISNIFKQYTFEDSLDNLPSMTEESYEKEIETFSNDNILPIIDVELEKLNFDDDEEVGFKAIETSLKNIMLKLKSVGD